jgi:N-acetylglutamate synthase
MVSRATVDILGLQERAARAQPVERVVSADGWWLRHAPGGPWWLSSALPHRAACGSDLAARVAGVEAFYAMLGVPARIQITPGACPEGLDRLLAGREYRRECPGSLQVAPTTILADEPSVQVEEDSVAAYARLWFGGDVIAVGRAVLDTGWAGIFGIATQPQARRRGAARAVLATLAHWAADHGAEGLYLQVEQDNEAARRLYHGAGFVEAAAYHYRIR